MTLTYMPDNNDGFFSLLMSSQTIQQENQKPVFVPYETIQISLNRSPSWMHKKRRLSKAFV